MDDGKRESSGDGGINGIASRLHHLDPGTRCQLVNAGDNGMGGVRRTKWRCDHATGEQRREHAEDQKLAVDEHRWAKL